MTAPGSTPLLTGYYIITLFLASLDPLYFVYGEITKGANVYCQNEIFAANCSNTDSVVVIEKAVYGRMLQADRCINTNYGFIGCYGDALKVTDRACSGKRSCRVSIPNKQLDLIKSSCPDDFKKYLSVSFTCKKVVNKGQRSCYGGQGSRVLSATSGKIASILTSETGCGRQSHPWLITSGVGQRISVWLLDYGRTGDTIKQLLPCQRYATLQEPGQQSHVVCPGNHRQRHLLTTEGHVLKVTVNNRELTSGKPSFIISYKVLGCATPPENVDTWVKRNSHIAEIGCRGNLLRWRKTCVNDTWNGPTYNCTDMLANGRKKISGDKKSWTNLSYELSIITISGIALLVGLLIFSCGIVCLRRLKNDVTMVDQSCDLDRQPCHPGCEHQSNEYNKENHDYDFVGLSDGSNTYASIQEIAGHPNGCSTFTPQNVAQYHCFQSRKI